MRCHIALVVAAVMVPAAMAGATTAEAQPPPRPGECNYPNCTPGITPHIVLGSYCNNVTYYVFGVTDWGRLVFCGSPRRYEPRWFRSPEMRGVKNLGDLCTAQEGEVAQAPDGLFLSCVVRNGRASWERGDL
ncbi:MAG: hypothetical protein AB1925_04615 [Actinomycetota bacterium]